VQVQLNDSGELLGLTQRWQADDEQHFKRLVVERKSGVFSSKVDMAPLVATQRIGSGTIKSSLFAATDEARMPDTVAVQMAEIFAGDIDFHRSLRKGDRFSVVYEALEADGEILRTGRVLSAEFINNGKAFGAIWFQPNGSKGGYFTAAGESLKKAYLTSPLEFSRITSGFKMRFHPLLNKWRAHLGVDYAAPTGTPARSVGDGVVDFAGWQNGYGNVVIIKHRSNHTTLYAHLSKINVRKGSSVSQGQTVGLVGSTGWSTGPHLHFEFRVDGVHKDPLTLARQSESIPLPATAMAEFKRHADTVRRDWASAASITLASAQ
jgi:murein DD-endopeptidase MepM/ murein hydrolase activator NlpD